MPPSLIFPTNGEYAQIFCFRIDMVGSEFVLANTSPGNLNSLNTLYRKTVTDSVKAANGLMTCWHGDGAVAFFATKGDADALLRHGEKVAREVIDSLTVKTPRHRFRIGAGTSPARFWTNIQDINSPGVVLAARLEDEARNNVIGASSILLIPEEIFSALDPVTQAKYTPLAKRLGNIKLYAYIPTGFGNLTSEPSPRPEPESPKSEKKPIPDTYPSIRPDDWPSDASPYLFIDAFPNSKGNLRFFDFKKHESWIMAHILSLPIGTPLFPDSSIRSNTLTLFCAEKADAPKRQICKFAGSGIFGFGDCGWSQLGWKGVFYPQVLNSILPRIVSFAYQYFTECLEPTDKAWFHVKLGNISGCERKTERIGAIPPKKFIYDRDISVFEQFDFKNGNQDLLIKSLYDKAMIESELDPQKWGYQTE